MTASYGMPNVLRLANDINKTTEPLRQLFQQMKEAKAVGERCLEQMKEASAAGERCLAVYRRIQEVGCRIASPAPVPMEQLLRRDPSWNSLNGITFGDHMVEMPHPACRAVASCTYRTFRETGTINCPACGVSLVRHDTAVALMRAAAHQTGDAGVRQTLRQLNYF